MELLMYGLTRIINKKMYDHFFLIREQKRKRAFIKPLCNLLQIVEKSKTNYLKSMAWILLLRNFKQKTNEGVGRTAKLIDRAYESTQRRLLTNKGLSWKRSSSRVPCKCLLWIR